MEEENKNIEAGETATEPVAETPVSQAPVAEAPVEPKQEEKKGSNKLLIIIAILLLVLGGGFIVCSFVLGGNTSKTEPKKEEEQKEEKKESISEEDAKNIVSKYGNFILVTGKNTVNPFSTFIDEQGRVLDLSTKEVNSRILNIILRNYYNNEETIELDDLKVNIKKMFKIEEPMQFEYYSCFTGNEDKAYKLIDNAYVKQADTSAGGAYSAMSNTIREKYIENTIDGNKLTIVYKVLFIGFESDDMKIYSDGERTKEVATLKNISTDPMIIEHEKFDDKFFEKGLTLKIIFEKEDDDYILEKVEKGE